jgi:hypothetical protein
MDLHIQYNAFDAVIAEVNVYLMQAYPSAVGTLFRVARRNKKFLQLCCHLCRSGKTNSNICVMILIVIRNESRGSSAYLHVCSNS